MGRTCVCGAESLDVDTKAREFRVRDGETIREGDVISIDGTTGEVFAGAVPVADSVVVRHFEGEKIDDDLAVAVARIMAHADGARRLRVRTNADTPEDAFTRLVNLVARTSDKDREKARDHLLGLSLIHI